MPKTYTIIVTHNGEKLIEKCLSGILDYPNNIIIIIDNNSQDNTLKIIEGIRAEQLNTKITLIKNKRNLGFGRANNIGLNIALENKADYVLLLNQDTYLVETHSLENMIRLSKKYPGFGILSPMHFNPSNKIDYGFSVYLIQNRSIISDLYFRKLKEIYEVPFVNASCWLITQECLNTVGGFDPLFYHYAEDNDYSKRTNNSGLKIGICPKSIIYHSRSNAAKDTAQKTRVHLFKIMYSQQIVLYFKNMNEGLTRLFLIKFYTLLIQIVENILKLHIKNAIINLGFLIKIMIDLPKIYKNRKITQRKKSFLILKK